MDWDSLEEFRNNEENARVWVYMLARVAPLRLVLLFINEEMILLRIIVEKKIKNLILMNNGSKV